LSGSNGVYWGNLSSGYGVGYYYAGGLNFDTDGGSINFGKGVGITGSLSISSLAGSGNRAVYSDSAGGLTNSSSDVSLKTNIESLQYGIYTIKQLNPIKFNWIDTDKRGNQKEIGFIAQEVQQVVPEVVGTNSDGTLSLDYPKMVAVLTKVLQEQQTLIEQLEARITALENK
jgi:hypothetical protein